MKRIWIVALFGAAFLLGCKRESKQAVGPSATPAPEATPFVITAATKWKTVEELDYAWKPGQSPVHFKLELPEGYDDPGDFIRISIQAKGVPEFVLTNDDGWIEYNNEDQQSDVYEKLGKQNLVQSRYVLVLLDSKRKGERPLVFLRSWGYASNAERLHVIGFKPSGEPVALFNKEFALADFSDTNNDGYSELVGFPCMSEGVGDDMGTYHPYQVYTISHPIAAPARLSVPLTREYTTKELGGWAGPECDDHHIIVWPKDKNKKPFLITEEEARRLEKSANTK